MKQSEKLPVWAGQEGAGPLPTWPTTEPALRQSEARYRSLFMNMTQGFCLIEKVAAAPGEPSDYRYVAVNQAFAKHTGLPDVTGKTLRQLVPGVEPRMVAVYDAALATGEIHYVEDYDADLDAWIAAEIFPDLQPGCLAVLFSNVSARHRAEQADAQLREFSAQLEQQVAERTQALQESRDLLHAIAENQTASLSAFKALRDEHGRLIDLEFLVTNTVTNTLAGGRPLVGQRCLQLFPELVDMGLWEVFCHVIETGELAERELAYAGGTINGWFHVIVTRLGDGLLVCGEDITARKQAEQERTKVRWLLEQLEAVANMGSWDYEPATGRVTWSAGMYRLFGLEPGYPTTPPHYLDFVVAEDRPIAQRLVSSLQAGASAFEETLRLRVGGDVKTVRVQAMRLPSEAGQPGRILGVDVDISTVQRLKAENQTLRLDQQQALLLAILQAQETERNRLAEGLHNGLGQLLYAIKLQVGQLDTPEVADVRNHVDRLLAEAIHQTRTLAHELMPTTLAEQGLGPALRDICRNLTTPQLQFTCQLWLDGQVLPPPLQTAVYRLAQELAHNIAKHAAASQAVLEFEMLPGWLSLRAEDNGRGFDPAITSKGLGLRLLYDAVGLLGGTVLLNSSPEYGTHIRLRIPITPA